MFCKSVASKEKHFIEVNELLISSFLIFLSGDKTKCRPDVCSNKGVCVQQWNTFTCDCDLTSFTGPNCLNGENFFLCTIFFFFL